MAHHGEREMPIFMKYDGIDGDVTTASGPDLMLHCATGRYIDGTLPTDSISLGGPDTSDTHPGGANFALGDGSVRFLSYSIPANTEPYSGDPLSVSVAVADITGKPPFGVGDFDLV